MKRIVLLISFLAFLGLCASAQTYIDFHQMPLAATPTLMPDFYPEEMSLYWDNFYYVTPGLWSAEGRGFWVDPATKHNTVAFIGGPLCTLAVPCNGSIKMSQIMMNPVNKTFAPISMSISAGWMPNKVIVTAYNNSKFVGRLVWQLTTKPQTFSFPAAWNITQLVFTPEFTPSNSVNPKAGSMVVYSFVLMEH